MNKPQVLYSFLPDMDTSSLQNFAKNEYDVFDQFYSYIREDVHNIKGMQRVKDDNITLLLKADQGVIDTLHSKVLNVPFITMIGNKVQVK